MSTARVFSEYLAAFSIRLTGAAHFFQEGTGRLTGAARFFQEGTGRLTGAARFFQGGRGPASFNSNRVDIPPGSYARNCYFCMLPRSLLVHFTWGKALTTANKVRHLNVTSPVVIIVRTLITVYVRTLTFAIKHPQMCSIRETRENYHEQFATYGKYIHV